MGALSDPEGNKRLELVWQRVAALCDGTGPKGKARAVPDGSQRRTVNQTESEVLADVVLELFNLTFGDPVAVMDIYSVAICTTNTIRKPT